MDTSICTSVTALAPNKVPTAQHRHRKTNGFHKLMLGLAALSSLGMHSAWAQTAWDMPTAYPDSNFHTDNIKKFAADVDKATGGSLKITVHSAGSLFKANEIKRAVQGGQAQIGEIIISGYSNEDPIFAVDSIPFLADDYSEAKKLWTASQPVVESRFNKQGMKILFTVAWPPQGIFSAAPIATLDDLKGVKWRAYSPYTSRIAQLVGAQAVTIQAAELSQALATGAVTAFMTSSATGVDSKVWEQVKYFYDVRAWLPKNAVIVSEKAFNALNPTQQSAVLKAAKDAEARGWALSEEKNNVWLAELEKNGMKVAKPTAILKTGLAQLGKTISEEWEKQAGEDGKKILDNYKK